MKENLTIKDLPQLDEETKNHWELHNSEYYHYFYRIDNTVNGMFYYGIHSQRIDSGKLPENDGYMGSGVAICNAEEIYGLDKFTKTILKTFSTRDEARLEEMIVVDEDMVNNPMCYNIALGGGATKSFSQGTILVNNRDPKLRKNKFFEISLEEYYKNTDKYITSSTGFGTFKNKDNNSEIKQLKIDDPLVLSGQFIGVTSGIVQSQEIVDKKTGEKNGSYGSFWITDGKKNRKIKNIEIPTGWRRGRVDNRSIDILKKANKVKYTNRVSLETIWMTKEEINNRADKDLWFTDKFYYNNKKEFISYEVLQNIYNKVGNWSAVSSYLKKDLKTISSIRDYYIDLGFKFSTTVTKLSRPGRLGFVPGIDGEPNKINIHKENLSMSVLESEVQKYLLEGWIRGKKKKE